MGTCIEAVATARPRGRLFPEGALHLSDAAIRSCLARGHHHAAELDLIVNVGLYKDHGLAEPALASIIQEDIGANPGHPPRPDAHGTFSFDILAGGGGVVTAAYLIDGFVSGAAKLGLIVAADSDPSPRTTRNFPFAPAGGAMLLARVDGDVGFERFVFETFPADAGMFEVTMRWDPHAGLIRRGRNVLEVYEAPAFAGRCIEHGVAVARRLLDDLGIAPAEVDALVANQYPRSFATGIANGLGLRTSAIPHVAPELANAHTAGPLAALEAVGSTRGTTLFVTASAGITIGAAVYRDRRLAA